MRSLKTGFIATKTNNWWQNALDLYNLGYIFAHDGGGGKVRLDCFAPNLTQPSPLMCKYIAQTTLLYKLKYYIFIIFSTSH